MHTNPKGFIGQVGEYIYYQRGKDVFIAHQTNVTDVRNGYLQGRWECTIAQWNKYEHLRQGLPTIP